MNYRLLLPTSLDNPFIKIYDYQFINRNFSIIIAIVFHVQPIAHHLDNHEVLMCIIIHPVTMESVNDSMEGSYVFLNVLTLYLVSKKKLSAKEAVTHCILHAMLTKWLEQGLAVIKSSL